MKKPDLIILRDCFIYLTVWAGLFLFIHFFHMRYFIVDVIFYETLKDLIFSGIISVQVYFLYLKKILKLSATNYFLSLCLGFTCGYIFAITIPTVIDRSLSAYILEKFVQRDGSIRRDALYDIFIDEFIPESQLMDIRLQEALSSGTLIISNDGCVTITPKGRRVAGFTRFYRKNLLPKKRLLLERVTDDLTDPFKASPSSVAYLCKGGDT